MAKDLKVDIKIDNSKLEEFYRKLYPDSGKVSEALRKLGVSFEDAARSISGVYGTLNGPVGRPLEAAIRTASTSSSSASSWSSSCSSTGSSSSKVKEKPCVRKIVILKRKGK